VDIREVTSERAAALKLKEPRGVEITLVDGDAPAGKAGLKEHDVILSFNGRNLQSGEELRKLIRETPAGQTVELGISRDGHPMTVKAQLADKHKVVVMKDYKFVAPKVRMPHVEVPIIAAYGRRHGVVVENLTPQLGEVFGVKNGEGVLVRSVEKGSPGDTAGVRAGDVIVRVGSERVDGASDWNRLMRAQKPGPVPIGIVREKRQQTVSLTVPERSAERSSARAFRDEFGHDLDFDLDMGDLGPSLEELNRLQPEIDRAMRETQERIQRELQRNQREWQRDAERAQKEAQREAERARREAQREAERARRQAQRDLEQAQRDREQALRDAQREQEQAQRDLERSQREQQQQQQEKPPEKPPPQ
jgi:hypothetical protein